MKEKERSFTPYRQEQEQEQEYQRQQQQQQIERQRQRQRQEQYEKKLPDIKDCIYEYIKGEYMHNFQCDKCLKKTTVHKSVTIWSFPKVLVITLNRFGSMSRDNSPILINYNISFQKNERTIIYRLKSIVNHQGFTAMSGHYNTNIIYNEETILIDDEHAYKINNIKHSNTAYILTYILQ